jgi:predicted RNase H-like HicB family nuclease
MDTRYRIEAEYTGGCWEVRFPQLPGCLGRSEDLIEAISAAEIAQEEYLVITGKAKAWSERCN